VCFTKDVDGYDFIIRLKNLSIIFNETIYDLTKMDESDFQDHVIQLRDAKKPRNATKLAKKKKVVEMVAHKTAVEKA